jgi:hypothetical protein
MENYKTIHLFSFGNNQIINVEENNSVSSEQLTKLTPFIDYIKTLAPSKVVITDYDVIHIFNEDTVRYMGEPTENRDDKTSFIIQWKKFDKTTLNELVNEIYGIINPVTTTTTTEIIVETTTTTEVFVETTTTTESPV